MAEQAAGDRLVIDTGDLVRVKHSRELRQIACVHENRIHLIGYPDVPVYPDDIELVSKDTAEGRLALLRALAGAASNGHRNQCARERLRVSADG